MTSCIHAAVCGRHRGPRRARPRRADPRARPSASRPCGGARGPVARFASELGGVDEHAPRTAQVAARARIGAALSFLNAPAWIVVVLVQDGDGLAFALAVTASMFAATGALAGASPGFGEALVDAPVVVRGRDAVDAAPRRLEPDDGPPLGDFARCASSGRSSAPRCLGHGERVHGAVEAA